MSDNQRDFHYESIPKWLLSKARVNITAALQDFTDNVGIPATLICEMASERT